MVASDEEYKISLVVTDTSRISVGLHTTTMFFLFLGWFAFEQVCDVLPLVSLSRDLQVYFTFPVVYVGAIVMPQSISSARHEAQTEITREAIAVCCDESIPNRAYVKRSLSLAAKQYAYGNVEPMMFDVKLSISATGIIIAPTTGDDDGIIGFYPMRNISLATGGEDLDYDFVSFTARDQDTGVRESHVFDCGMQSDDVMTTLGQAFAMVRARSRFISRSKVYNSLVCVQLHNIQFDILCQTNVWVNFPQ